MIGVSLPENFEPLGTSLAMLFVIICVLLNCKLPKDRDRFIRLDVSLCPRALCFLARNEFLLMLR